jgi:hypothetical protein
VGAGSNVWTIFVRSNAGIVGSNPTKGMDFYVRLFCVYVVLCVGSSLATGWSPVQGVPQSVLERLRNWRRCQGPTKGCRAMDELMNEWKSCSIMFSIKTPVKLTESLRSSLQTFYSNSGIVASLGLECCFNNSFSLSFIIHPTFPSYRVSVLKASLV